MKGLNRLSVLLLLSSLLILSGCVVRTYQATKDRVDQDLTSGNRGYLVGKSSEPEKERKATRTIQVVEVELRSPVQFEKGKKAAPKETIIDDSALSGNRGYVTPARSIDEITIEEKVTAKEYMQEYKIKKGDTLQKISREFYGTTKKWKSIYDANRDVLKAPDKIYPGQTIYIPMAGSEIEITESQAKFK